MAILQIAYSAQSVYDVELQGLCALAVDKFACYDSTTLQPQSFAHLSFCHAARLGPSATAWTAPSHMSAVG